MKNIVKISIMLLLAFLFFCDAAVAQDTEEIRVSAKGTTSRNINLLRWAPENYTSWLKARKFGYKITRTWIGADGELFDEPREVVNLDQVFRPATEQEWRFQSSMDTLAVSALYDTTFQVFVTAGNSNNKLVKAYQLEEERKNRFIYSLYAAEQSTHTAQQMGLFFDDREVTKGFGYTYYIYPYESDDKVGAPGIVTIWTAEQTPLPALPKPIVQSADKVALLDINLEGVTNYYSSYDLYRRPQGTGNFMKMNATPIIFTNGEQQGGEYINYMSPLPNNTTTYEFYFIGKTAFGTYGGQSPVVTAKGIPAPLKASITMKSALDVNGSVKLEWTFPDSLNAKIKGFKVFTANDALGVFAPMQTSVLSNTTRTFLTKPPTGAAYYRIKAYDLYDREISSIDVLGQIKDITPPVKSVLKSCTCTPDGLVTLTWNKNPDADILGYRVFLSSIKTDTSYFQVTKDLVTDSTFEYQVTMNTLTRNTYFRIAAEDYHFNHSVLSDICTMVRPDVIPPVSPVITKADITRKGVDMAWINSNSSDVVLHRVERKELIATGQWEVLKTFVAKKTSDLPEYLDSMAVGGHTYLYRIVAEDAAHLLAYSETMTVKPMSIFNRVPVQNIIAYCDCTYSNKVPTGSGTDANPSPTLSPTVNGNHPVIDVFHLNNRQGSYFTYETSPYFKKPGDLNADKSVVLEWEYEDTKGDLVDFVIYRELSIISRVEYGFAQPYQMDMVYDPEVYTFLGLDQVKAVATQNGFKTLLPIRQSKMGQKHPHQFLDHRIPARYVGGGKNQPSFPVKYSIVARFADGSETVISKDIEVYF